MENWAKILYTYGPFALIILCVFVIERQSRAALAAHGIPRLVPVLVYALNWCMIFVLCGTVTYFWAIRNLPHEETIRGTFEGLKSNESLFSDSDGLWLQRDYTTEGKYHWRIITPEKVSEGKKESLTIQAKERAFKYELPVRSNFYDSDSRVQLRIDRGTGKLRVDYAGKHEELAPLEALSSAPSDPRPSSHLPVVYAQSSVSLDDIFERLESDDPIVRQNARRDLAAQGQVAVPRIERVLRDPKAGYRLQLGALVALNLMHNVTVSPEARASIAHLYEQYRNSDPVLSSEAERYLHNLPAPTCGVRCGVERWAVKSLTDEDASKINFTAQPITIDQLIGLDAPATIPRDRRVAPAEFQAYKLEGILVRSKKERDNDFHLTIADPKDPSRTMVVEIPDPQCSNVCASPQVNRISKARDLFIDRFQPTSSFTSPLAPVRLTVTGVGFFDYNHHQDGRAPNGIELHPVLDLEVHGDVAAVARREFSQTFRVDARQRWTPTHINVKKGDTISLTAKGQIEWGHNKYAGPEGDDKKCKAASPIPYPVDSICVGGLIAKIGSGKAFAVGKELRREAQETGELYLGINDNSYNDNSGEFIVSIVLSTSQ